MKQSARPNPGRSPMIRQLNLMALRGYSDGDIAEAFLQVAAEVFSRITEDREELRKAVDDAIGQLTPQHEARDEE